MMIKSIPNIFTKDFQHWKKIEYFRTILYIFLLFNTITLLPIAQEVWGYDGIVGTRGWDTNNGWVGSYGFLNILSHPANSHYWWVYIVFVMGQLTFLVTGLLRILPKLSSVMVYFFTVNLFLKGYLLFTGGEVLIILLLFYLMFVQRSDKASKGIISRYTKEEKNSPSFSILQNVFNNTFYWAMLIQVCILYFFSTFYKLFDEHWLSGDAIMYVSRIPVFSSRAFESLFADNHALSVVATYGTLLYQGLFSILVWIKKIKFPFLIIGAVFHISIAFGMGIFTFGIIMTLVYMLFLDIEQLEKVKAIFSRKKKAI